MAINDPMSPTQQCLNCERCVFLPAILLIFFCFITCASAWAQGGTDALVDRADKFFTLAKNYEAALPLYQQAVDTGVSDPMVHYRLGVCYTQTPSLSEQYRAIPYLEYALKQKAQAGIPDQVHYYLGQMYHKDIKVDEATRQLETYQKTLADGDKDRKEVDRLLEVCKNAQFLIAENKGIVIHSFKAINSKYTEYNPLITADESMLAYTAVREEKGKITEKIYTAQRDSRGRWSEATPIAIKSKSHIGTAGISPDGQDMLVFIAGANNTGSLYTIHKEANGWSNPVTLGNPINSQYLETTASITPDGKTIYFASNRRDSYGGLDLYKSEKQPDGRWGAPENLGSDINTKYDEDAPFIHPDSRTLFFNSNGHNTMGGTDIFKTYFAGGKWQPPTNLGYPINTPTNDSYFTLTANAKIGYFSSERKGGQGGQDIYYFEMPAHEANIPITLIKGKILVGEDELKPVPTKIKVVDVDANREVQYVYSPDPATGKYLIILPPGKNYDLIIESEGYLPYTVNINLPNQQYFYELYQEITLRPIKQFDVTVGQEVSVKNAFYDTKNEEKSTARIANETMLVKNDSVDTYALMESIIAAGDEQAYEYLLGLMHETNPIEDINFDETVNDKIEAARIAYYYDETGKDNLIAKKVGDETIYTLPTFYVTMAAINGRDEQVAPTNFNLGVLEEVRKVYFDAGKSVVDSKYTAMLTEVLKTLKNHSDLGIQISGYASPEGDTEANRKLSNQRAAEVLNFFNQRGVVRRRIVALGYGETSDDTTSAEEGRRVEIKLVDLNQVGR